MTIEYRGLGAGIAACLWLAACGGADHERPLDERETLTVLTTNSPTTYYIDRDGEPEGYEYRLTQALGESLDLKVEYKILNSVEDVLTALARGKGDLAAAGLTDTPARRARFGVSPAYKTIVEEVVCRRRGAIPETAAELDSVSIIAAAGSSYLETLQALKADHPDISWRTVSGGTEAALEEVWSERADCTIADSNIVAVNRRYYPELEVAFALPDDQSLVWMTPADAAPLQEHLAEWLPETGDFRAALDERFYAYIPVFDFVDIRALRQRLKSRYPDYSDHIEAAAKQYDLPVAFLAAQAYQESHWDPDAVSPTGVRGIMMLTGPTAQRVGVDNRLDPRQSIFGGAKYMRELLDRLPEDIHGDDRYWFALTAYNLGLGHLYDARALAERRGLDKNRWRDVRSVLPDLARRDVSRTLKYGFARGHEAVRYVRRVRNYRDIIRRELDAA